MADQVHLSGDSTIPKDHFNEVAKGNVPGSSIAIVSGYTPVASNTSTDVWSYGDRVLTYTPLADGVATIDTISGSSSADVGVPILIVGLTADGTQVVQTVVLNGQGKVPLATPLWRINIAQNVGGTALLGEVFIYVDTAITLGEPNDSNQVKEHIPIGRQISKHGFYTAPKDTNVLIRDQFSSLSKQNNASSTVGR